MSGLICNKPVTNLLIRNLATYILTALFPRDMTRHTKNVQLLAVTKNEESVEHKS